MVTFEVTEKPDGTCTLRYFKDGRHLGTVRVKSKLLLDAEKSRIERIVENAYTDDDS